MKENKGWFKRLNLIEKFVVIVGTIIDLVICLPLLIIEVFKFLYVENERK